MATDAARAGRYIQQPAGYRAFIPAALPPDPPLSIDQFMLGLLSRADQAMGRLDGLAQTLPNPDLFVAMYVRREAVLSSQIEGTQSTLEDVLTYELDPRGRGLPWDIEEVVNYVRAMNYGLERLSTLPLSLRLIREIHAELLRDVRGAERMPGEFRTSQNWIGSANVPLARATFVPPPPAEMRTALGDLERFLHVEDKLPVLIRAGLAHAQFETIHPFLDGNGRVGRLLITFLLVHDQVLRQPLLYLSHYLKRYRTEYYDRLMAVREHGDWEGWIRFFLQGVAETADEATDTARRIVALRETHRTMLQERDVGMNALRLLDLLYQHPLINANAVRESLQLTLPPVYRLLERFEELGIVQETTGGQRNRRYRYTPYLALFEEDEVVPLPEAQPMQTTESDRRV
jgi:Fic family protein